jgi:hypothetical protein
LYFTCEEENEDYHEWMLEEEGDPPWYRRFGLYELTAKEIEIITKKHKLFQKYVGTHTDYDPITQKRKIGATKPQSEWNKYYRLDTEKLEISILEMIHRTPIAWFED